jgi:hypothetical protein
MMEINEQGSPRKLRKPSLFKMHGTLILLLMEIGFT